MRTDGRGKQIWKNIFDLLDRRHKRRFLWIAVILAVSAALSQLTPLAVGYLTDHVLAGGRTDFLSVVPILLVILVVNVVNEVIKVVRRLMVEDTATQAEKSARGRATASLLHAPLSYFRAHMTGNIHGRLNRSLEGTVKLVKLLFMDFAPAVTTGVAAIVTIFVQLPAPVAALVILVIPVGTFIVLRQISTQKGIRVELMETKADMDGTMVELLGGIETIRALDSAQAESDRPILRDIDLTIPAGRFIGIAGPSGCGKSSLIKVLDKLEQAAGEVRIGGAPLELLSRATLAEYVALVPQTPFLIADTVFHNICYGLRREVTLDEVCEAARKANIAADIEAMPQGYDTPLSEGGANLSGGQRQRIALARIFLKKPRVLILDEATSALDNTSEKHVQAEIERMMRDYGTTVISIAHRLTTLQNCDEILVMAQGEIVQRGSYQTLLDTPGIFRDMAQGVLK